MTSAPASSEDVLSRRRVVILAPPNSQSLEIAGLSEVFAFAELKLREAGRMNGCGYSIQIASATDDPDICSLSGLRLTADLPFHQVQGPIDTLIVAGGMDIWMPSSPGLLEWVRGCSKTARRIGSVCTGTFLLAEAGLLNGRRVTTHWYFAQKLAERFPNVIVDPEPIYTRDGNLSTAAGGTSNLDLALAMVEDDLGTDIALRIARGLILFVRRPAGQKQFSTALTFQSSGRRPFRELPVFILENLGQSLGVDLLAAKAAMSVRNFSRLFRQEYGVTPASFVETMRLETAQRLVCESNKGLEEIARDCGLGGIDAMRRAFLVRFAQSPAEMRSHALRPT